MKANDKLQILIFLLMILNSFFVILGISLFGCAAWILFDKSNFITVLSSEENVKVIAATLFVIGLLVICVSVLGCIGAHLESRCFIVFYLAFLFAIILGLLFVIVVVLIAMNKVESVLNQTVDDIIRDYGTNITNAQDTTWRLLDGVQQSVKCCGRVNSSDWQRNSFIQAKNMADIYPCSCFNGSCSVVPIHEIYQFGNGSDLYTMGCGEKMKDWFQENLFAIIGMDVGLLLIQVVQITLSIYIYKCIGVKIEDLHSKKLLNAMEVNLSPETDLPTSDQPEADPYHQQPDNAYDQQYAGHEGQVYVGHTNYQYHEPYYQPDHEPEPNGQIYHQKYNNEYDEDAGQFHDQHYQRDGLNYMQTPNGNYNQGYDQDYNYTNHYDGY